MNDWGIPTWLESKVRARDTHCVYCGIKMITKVPRGAPRKAAATWEHIINDASIITRENIALCCSSCNASKGTQRLSKWIKSAYCQEHGINTNTVADVIKQALRDGA